MRPEDRPCVTVAVAGWDNPETARGWTYWVPGYIGKLERGDHVIVEAPRDFSGKLLESSGIPVAAVVTEVDPPMTIRKKASKWLVCKIDWEPYRAIKALALNEGHDDG